MGVVYHKEEGGHWLKNGRARTFFFFWLGWEEIV